MKRPLLILSVVASIVCLVYFVVPAMLNLVAPRDRIVAAVEAALQTGLGPHVSIGDIKIDSLDSVTLKDVSYDGDAEFGVRATIDEVVVGLRFSISDLIHRDWSPEANIRSIRLTSPTLVWNPKEGAGSGAAFDIKGLMKSIAADRRLTTARCNLEVVDGNARISGVASLETVTLQGLKGRLYLDGGGRYRLEALAKVAEIGGAEVSLVGRADVSSLTYQLSAVASQAPIPQLAAYLERQIPSLADVELASGSADLQLMIEQDGTKSPTLILKGAFSDLSARYSERSISLDKASGTFVASPGSGVKLTGVTAQVNGSRFRIDGTVSASTGSPFSLNIDSKQVDLSSITPVLKRPGLEASGSVDVAGVLHGDFSRLQFDGEATLHSVSVSDPSLGEFGPITVKSGKIVSRAGHFELVGMEGSISSSPFKVSGDFTLDPSLVYNLDLATSSVSLPLFMRIASRCELDQLNGVTEIAGARADAAIRGTSDKVSITGALSADRLTYESLPFSAVSAGFIYENDQLEVSALSAEVMGGQVGGSLDGKKTSAGWQIEGSLRARGIDLRRAPYEAIAKYADASIDGTAAITYGADKGLQVVGTASSDSPKLSGVRFDRGEAQFRYDRDHLRLDSLTLESAGSRIVLDGSVGPGLLLNLGLLTLGPASDDLLHSLGVDFVDGSVSLKGKITGSAAAPSFQGTATMGSGALWGSSVRSASMEFRYGDNAIDIDGLDVADSSGSVSVKGRVELGQAPGLQLTAVCRGAELGSVIDPLGYDLSGSGLVDGTITISGPFGGLTASSDKVTIRGPSYLGYSADSLSGSFTYRAGVLSIPSASLRKGSSLIDLRQASLRDGRIDLSLSGVIATLDDVRDLIRLPVGIEGSLSLAGTVTGTASSPVFSGTIGSAAASVAGVPIARLDTSVLYRNGRVTLSSITASSGQSSVEGAGYFDLAQGGDFSLQVLVRGGRLEWISPLLPRRWASVSGFVDGTVTVARTNGRSSSSVDAVARQVSLCGSSFASVSAKLAVGPDATMVDKVTVIDTRGGAAELSGKALSSGGLSLSGTLTRIDLANLGVLLGLGDRVGGSITANWAVTGSYTSPVVSLRGRVDDGLFREWAIDSVSGGVAYSNGLVTIESIEVSQGAYSGRIKGRVPVPKRVLSSVGVSVPQRPDEMSVTISASPVDLSVASLFFPGIANITGTASIDLNVMGTVEDPRFYGSASVRNGGFTFDYLGGPVTDFEGSMVFNGRSARIESMGASVGAGRVIAAGTVEFDKGSTVDLDLSVAARSLPVKAPGFTGDVDSDVVVRGDLRSPRLSGKATLSRAVLSLDEPIRIAQSDRSTDLGLDLTVDIGQDVRVKRPEFDIEVYGSLYLGGTMASPSLKGTVESRKGQIAYLGKTFKVTSGIAEFTGYPGLMPTITVNSQTRGRDATIFVTISGNLADPQGLRVALDSDPPMSQTEIASQFPIPGAIDRLLKGDVSGLLEQDVESLFGQEIRYLLEDNIEEMLRKALQVDEFSLEDGQGSGLSISIGKYVTKDIYMTFTRDLSSESDDSIEIEFRLHPYVTLNGRLSSKGEAFIGVETQRTY